MIDLVDEFKTHLIIPHDEYPIRKDPKTEFFGIDIAEIFCRSVGCANVHLENAQIYEEILPRNHVIAVDANNVLAIKTMVKGLIRITDTDETPESEQFICSGDKAIAKPTKSFYMKALEDSSYFVQGPIYETQKINPNNSP